MIIKTVFGSVGIFLMSTASAQAGGFSYSDYVESYKSKTSTYYFYNSSITRDGSIVNAKVLETKKELHAPKSKSGEPYIAIKYSYKYDCASNKYAGGPTDALQIESGWTAINQAQIDADKDNWLVSPGKGTFLDALKALCKKQ